MQACVEETVSNTQRKLVLDKSVDGRADWFVSTFSVASGFELEDEEKEELSEGDGAEGEGEDGDDDGGDDDDKEEDTVDEEAEDDDGREEKQISRSTCKNT